MSLVSVPLNLSMHVGVTYDLHIEECTCFLLHTQCQWDTEVLYQYG